MENNINNSPNIPINKPDNNAESLKLSRIEQIFIENGKTAEDYQASLEKLGQAINAQTTLSLLTAKPPGAKLKAVDVDSYIAANFSESEIVNANNVASSKIISEWLSIITRKNN